MTLRGFVLVLVLLAPTMARAEPISVGGTWSRAATALASGVTVHSPQLTPFWGGASWDGWEMGVYDLLQKHGATGLDYLNDGAGNYTSFRFEEDVLHLTKIDGLSAWSNGQLGRRSDGAFTYDTGTGLHSNSWDNPGQFALFRLVGAEAIHYFLGVEDIPLSFPRNDRDYNDYVAKFDTPQPVPEPATLLLLGSGMAALAARRKLAARKARGAATV